MTYIRHKTRLVSYIVKDGK